MGNMPTIGFVNRTGWILLAAAAAGVATAQDAAPPKETWDCKGDTGGEHDMLSGSVSFFNMMFGITPEIGAQHCLLSVCSDYAFGICNTSGEKITVTYDRRNALIEPLQDMGKSDYCEAPENENDVVSYFWGKEGLYDFGGENRYRSYTIKRCAIGDQ